MSSPLADCDAEPIADNTSHLNFLVQDAEQPAQPLSKSARKKAAKAARFAILKLERRAREKAAKKEKKREAALKRAAGEEVEESDAQRQKKRLKKGEENVNGEPFGARVVVDLGFDEMMTEKEITSLTSQLAYTYAVNRRSSRPFASLIFTSLNGRTKARLDSQNDAGYRRWARTEWWEGGYEGLWEGQFVQENNEENLGRGRCPEKSICDKDRAVYLTADAAEELVELKAEEVYIIGGICDHNRYKNLCLTKAEKHNLRAARLPIGRYLAEMTTRKVLTVNQVFEILVKWVEVRDWEEALYSVVPQRKFEGKAVSRGSADDDQEDDMQQEVPTQENTATQIVT